MRKFPAGILLLLSITLALGMFGCDDDDDVTGPGVVVTVSPETATINSGGSQQFTATVTGATNTAVTWTVEEEGPLPIGTISSTGLYTAPGGGEIQVGGTSTVRATSVADTTKSATAVVTVQIPGPGDWSPEF